jgi:HAD superfamily hydrolase (TIGR01549 family)
MFRNIIWDVDGTLFDTYPGIAGAFKAALNSLGKDASLDLIEELAKESINHCVSVLANKYQLNVEKLGQAFTENYDRVKAENQPPFPGVVELCHYICSMQGKNVIVTHRGQFGTQELLSVHKMNDYFSGLITRDAGYPRKPDPAAFIAALTQFNLDPKETMTIGDRSIDIQAGQRAELFSCYFGAEPDNVKPDCIISSFAELYPFLVAQHS